MRSLVYARAFEYMSVMIVCQIAGFACFLIYMPLSKAQDGRIEKWGRSKGVRDHTGAGWLEES